MKAIGFTITLIIASTCHAQMTPSMVNTPDSPVRLVSTTASPTDFLSEVTVKNVSTKDVTSFQLGVIKFIPAECGPAPVYDAQELMRPDSVQLSANQLITVRDLMFLPSHVQNFGQVNLARDVFTQLAVVRVIFSDGTEWKLKRSGRVYDDQQAAANVLLRCTKSTKATLALAAAKAKCTLVGFAAGGSFYQCSAGNGQICSNSSDAKHCTNSFCDNPQGCPDQVCQGVVVQPAPGPR